jgi:hypothetical protein
MGTPPPSVRVKAYDDGANWHIGGGGTGSDETGRGQVEPATK